MGQIPGFVNIEMVGFPHLFSFPSSPRLPLPETVYRLGVYNPLAEERGAEEKMLSKCSLSMIVANKASV